MLRFFTVDLMAFHRDSFVARASDNITRAGGWSLFIMLLIAAVQAATGSYFGGLAISAFVCFLIIYASRHPKAQKSTSSHTRTCDHTEGRGEVKTST
jgi:hypothetical protein